MYIDFRQPSHATDSEVTEDDIIIRHEEDDIIGITVLRVSQGEELSGLQVQRPDEV